MKWQKRLSHRTKNGKCTNVMKRRSCVRLVNPILQQYMFVDWAFSANSSHHYHGRLNERMEQSCLVIEILFIRQLQHKHTIRKLSSWREVFKCTRLQFDVRCKMSTLKPGTERSLCKFRVDPSLHIIWLHYAASPEGFFPAYHSGLTFLDLTFYRQDRSHRQASPRS